MPSFLAVTTTPLPQRVLCWTCSRNVCGVLPLASAGIYVPGTYTADAVGMGKVIVSVTVDENAITAVEIDGSQETPEIGGAAIETLQQQVMDAQGAEIDGVSGATLTTNAVKMAVEAALAQAASADEALPAAA